MQLKANRAQNVPCRILTVNGDPLVGVVYTDVTASIVREDTTRTDLGLLPSASWATVQGGAYQNQAVYYLTLPASVLAVTGTFTYAVIGPINSIAYFGAFEVVSQQAQDIYDLVNLSGSNLSASLVASTALLSGAIINNSASLRNEILGLSSSLDPLIKNVSASLGAGVDRLRLTEEGRWRIDQNANTMTFYRDDGVTVWKIFGLSGSNGSPTTVNPFERNRVG